MTKHGSSAGGGAHGFPMPPLPPRPDLAVFCCVAPLGAFTLGIATPALFSKMTLEI